MSATMRHVRAVDVMSATGVNRVNRPPTSAAPPGDHRGSSKNSGGLVWRNIGALKALLGRAERELAREPGAYVAVAVVRADKREEQVGRWGWAGTADTGGKVADIGNRLAGDARGLRVRAHHDGGRLLGSVLLRRARRDAPPQPEVVMVTGSGAAAEAAAERRLAALEAQLAQALGRIQEQDREIRSLRGEVARVEHLPNAVGNMHLRLDAVEAVCERIEDAEARAHEHEEEEEEQEEEEQEEEEDEGDFEDEDEEDDDDP